MTDCVDKNTLCILSVFCFLHQYHLIVKQVLTVLDGWSWAEWGVYDVPCTYFSGVATVANTWKSPGMPRKVRDTCAREFGETVSLKLCARVPGRCIKGRWGSVESCENIIHNGGFVLADVFKFAAAASTKPKPTSRGLDLDDDGYREGQHRYKQTSAEFLSHEICRATVRISKQVKEPLTRFAFWLQKHNKEMRKKHQESEGVYVGPSTLSELVAVRAQHVYDDICANLKDLVFVCACVCV